MILRDEDYKFPSDKYAPIQSWEDLFLPYFCRLADAFQELGLYYWKHSGGNIMPVISIFVDTGIDGIDPIDPVAGMNLSYIKNSMEIIWQSKEIV